VPWRSFMSLCMQAACSCNTPCCTQCQVCEFGCADA
jgi:hypothetical protein